MARPLRVEFDNASYHVTARGNHREAIFGDDADRITFLGTLGEAAARFGLLVRAYCLMRNHYHLLLTTPRGNLSRAMGWLQGAYTTRYNHHWRRAGHLMQGRFKAHLIEADAYAEQLVRYIHLNPVRPRDRAAAIPADRREKLEAYRWSSHRAFAGTAPADEWLSLEWLSYWGPTPAQARRRYRGDLAGAFGKPLRRPLDDVRGGLVLGGDALWSKARALLARRDESEAMHWTTRAGEAALLEGLTTLTAGQADARVRMWLWARFSGRTLADLAREHGYRDGSGVLRVAQRLEAKAKHEAGLHRTLEQLERAAKALSNVKI